MRSDEVGEDGAFVAEEKDFWEQGGTVVEPGGTSDGGLFQHHSDF